MKNTFFTIKLTEEQKKLFGLDVPEVVAIDFCKVPPSETDRDRKALTLTKEQKEIVAKATGEDPDRLRITWRPMLEALPSHDIRAIENATNRHCDMWSVPSNT